MTVSTQEDAPEDTDFVILAVPDDLIGTFSDEVVPKLKSGAMVMMLDPAAVYADVLHDRDDTSYFLTHPCHPLLFKLDRPPEFADDWFGRNGKTEQDIVCALPQGPEDDYARGQAISQDIFAPVRTAHRLTTEQMAFLEPSLAESLSQTLLDTIHRGMEEVIHKGVPEEAAYDFLICHIRIQIAVSD